MIKIENVEVHGWEPAIRGMRNPKNSWDRMDSFKCEDNVPIYYKCDKCFMRSGEEPHDICSKGSCDHAIGPNDHKLMMDLANGGPVHAKYRRMITVYVDITAPLYWLAEMDTYKVGVVRNSCSFMHKGLSKPFEIDDFSLKNEQIYEVLRDLPEDRHELIYPYETDDYKPYTDINGRTYRVYRNGKVIREAFEYVDTRGRTRHYNEQVATTYRNSAGYHVVSLSGRNGGKIQLHRLVASLWCDKPDGVLQVNHIDGNKGNNSAENLEWVSAMKNIHKAHDEGLYNNLQSPHRRYLVWKNNCSCIPTINRTEFMFDAQKGLTHKELAEKYNITPSQANNIRYIMLNSGHEALFQEVYIWDKLINELNRLRNVYTETGDMQVFQEIRSLVPQGYMQRSTFMLNYEVLANIYEYRKNHKLDEWVEFCKWIESLPYSEIITGVKGER